MADKCKECGSREPKPMHDVLGHDPKSAEAHGLTLEAHAPCGNPTCRKRQRVSYADTPAAAAERQRAALKLLAEDVKRGNQ